MRCPTETLNSMYISPTEYQYSKWTNWMSCDSFDKYRPEMYQDRACHFSLLDLEDCIYDSFGFEDGQPCILFNLERVRLV